MSKQTSKEDTGTNEQHYKHERRFQQTKQFHRLMERRHCVEYFIKSKPIQQIKYTTSTRRPQTKGEDRRLKLTGTLTVERVPQKAKSD